MKTLRGKIFLYVSLLLILPSIPLSFFVLELLDRSYRIGVNDRVESALDGALEISADMYQMHRSRLNSEIERVLARRLITEDKIKEMLSALQPGVEIGIISADADSSDDLLITTAAIMTFIEGKKDRVIWPGPDHTVLYALTKLPDDRILQIKYPMPSSFQDSAGRIQEVNQIFKTLSYAKKDIRDSFLYTFLSIYAIGVIIALLVLNRFSKRISRPVKQLTAATGEIGRGHLNHRVYLPGKDEFAVLGTAFNNMAMELADNQRKIIDLEKTAAWQQLARRLAHEIKNPLTPIQLMTQQMMDSYQGNDEKYRDMLAECYGIIDEELESLKRLVREFSDFARLPSFHIESQSVLPLMETLEKLYQAVNVFFELPESELVFPFDMDYLKRALINLVDNALAAGDEKSKVVVSVREVMNKIKIQVTDQGEGISADNLSRIFEPYYSSKRSGVGLGLPIVKKIVEEHGGEIDVMSTRGKGAVFSIILPGISENESDVRDS